MDKEHSKGEYCPHGSGMFLPHPPNEPREGRRVILPPLRGIYSELIITSGESPQQSYTQGPVTQQSLLCRAAYESNALKAPVFKKTPDLHSVVEDWFGPSTQHPHETDFHSGSYTPKVQLPYICTHDQVPRKIEMERRKREYQKFDIAKLLAEHSIDSNLLVPRNQQNAETETESACLPVSNRLPLEIFDNEEFDCRTPEEWLALGYEEGSCDCKPVPAKALLPTKTTIPSVDPKSPSLVFSWQLVGVLEYSQEKNQYLVQKADTNGRVRDSEGKPIVNGAKRTKGVLLLQDGQYWVPRIRLLFFAEDPRVFAQRVLFAQKSRQETEASLLYHLSIDCMPVWSGSPTLDPRRMEHIKAYACSTPGLQLELLQECEEQLEKEIHLEFSRTMNQMCFDKVVQENPEEFSYIKVPQKEPERVPKRGLVPVPVYPFENNRKAFVFNSLLTKPEVIAVLSKVREECDRVVEIGLFQITFRKPLPLEEFESAQSHKCTEVQLFLQDSWLTALRSGILSNLSNVGRGWYNLTSSRWDVYCMSKLCRLMALVRCIQQDSLRFLVEVSLARLAELVLDACHSVIHCPKDLSWGSDLKNSPYMPNNKPLFTVELVLDQTGVRYSTPLESFETSVVNMFDKGILSTHNVPQLDKFVLKNLFIAGDLVLDSVGLWEPEVKNLKETISLALRQAVIPLKAYADEYKCYLELHNLDINTFLELNSQENQTPQEVRQEVLEHLKQMENLDKSIPSVIVLGPFLVSVEEVRQSLVNKRRALANAVLNRLALRLRQQMQDACKECKAISTKLFEKPSNIEELTEQREWMKLVPEQLKAHEVYLQLFFITTMT